MPKISKATIAIGMNMTSRNNPRMNIKIDKGNTQTRWHALSVTFGVKVCNVPTQQ